jgi:hypothetical protein
MDAIELILAEVRALVGDDDAQELRGDPGSLFLPTGPLQELAISSGWGAEFLRLADRYDCASTGRATHLCECGNAAGTLVCENGVLIRTTFTGTLTQAESAVVRAALGDAKALHALDFELAPFYCPACERSYCGAHWTTRDVFEDERFHDSIRGICPKGHERLLED